MDQNLIKRIIEAALLAAGQPLTVAQLSGLFPEEQPAPPGAIERALGALAEDATQRGVELVEVASGFRFQVRQDVQPWVSRLWTDRQTRYSRALLETLALIAYRQPITRGEIEQIRGVAVSSNMVRTLEEREWVRVVGHRDVPGKPALYGTTRTFLDYFGLRSLDQLPPLSELREIPDLEPQLALEPVDNPPGRSEAQADVDADVDVDVDVETDTDTDTDAQTGFDSDTVDTESDIVDIEGDIVDTDSDIVDTNSDIVDTGAVESGAESGIEAEPEDEPTDDPEANTAEQSAGTDAADTVATDDDGTAPSDTPTEGPTATVRPEHTA